MTRQEKDEQLLRAVPKLGAARIREFTDQARRLLKRRLVLHVFDRNGAEAIALTRHGREIHDRLVITTSS